MKDFCLSDEIIDLNKNSKVAHLLIGDVRETIRRLKEKILIDWKGQNECIEFIDKIFGEELC